MSEVVRGLKEAVRHARRTHDDLQTPRDAMIAAIRNCVNGPDHDRIAEQIMDQLAQHGFHVEEFMHPADDFIHASRLLRRIGYTPEEARSILKITEQ